MKLRMLLLAAAMLVFACSGFGQGFDASINYFDFFNNNCIDVPGLTTGCNGEGAILADDPASGPYSIEIRWDQNNNGYDVSDPLPTVGPEFGEVNYDHLRMNGTENGDPGTFYAEVNFQSHLGLPPNPTYYLLIRCSDGSPHLVSSHFTLNAAPVEINLCPNNWTCVPCVIIPPCIPTPEVVFHRDPVPYYWCADLCPEFPTLIRVCPNPGTPGLDPNKPPIVTVTAGCDPLFTRCDRQCDPATEFFYNPGGWIYDPAGCWVNAVIGGEGCVCICLEGFEQAEFNNDFVATAMDNSVKLTWSTASETGVARFDIIRDGNKVGEMTAANGTTTHAYTYVDESAENGTTYRYTLRIVNNDATTSDLATAEATPNFNAAVITEYALHQNFPNPFNPTTTIAFDVVEKNIVTLKVFNATGQEVATLANGSFDSGRHVVSFEAGNLPSGLYFFTVKIGNEFSATKKMLLVK